MEETLKVFGYGEDALTLWAIAKKLDEILQAVGDDTPTNSAVVFFRPSFGRRGGPERPEFGEFDFVIATPLALYLGETKWQHSYETSRAAIVLRPEQIARHQIFTAYYRHWVTRPTWDWQEYCQQCTTQFFDLGIEKPVPPPGSLLGKNLQHVLSVLAEKTSYSSTVKDVLLIVKTDAGRIAPTWQAPAGFQLVVLDASSEVKKGFLPMTP